MRAVWTAGGSFNNGGIERDWINKQKSCKYSEILYSLSFAVKMKSWTIFEEEKREKKWQALLVLLQLISSLPHDQLQGSNLSSPVWQLVYHYLAQPTLFFCLCDDKFFVKGSTKDSFILSHQCFYLMLLICRQKRRSQVNWTLYFIRFEQFLTFYH